MTNTYTAGIIAGTICLALLTIIVLIKMPFYTTYNPMEKLDEIKRKTKLLDNLDSQIARAGGAHNYREGIDEYKSLLRDKISTLRGGRSV
jgi:hypothetical protein